MADIALDNYLEDLTLCIGRIHLHGFLSKHGVANFLNVPYAKVPTRFRTATPIPILNLPADLDVSQYGPRCPQKPNPLENFMGHVFEKLSSSPSSDESTCLNLNIYAPTVALDSTTASRLPVFVWIHGGAFNNGDNTAQFGMFSMCSLQTHSDQPLV
jgi:carboxylesterase type B